ncbi:hypothetical protein CHS0354_022158 [Potamilus streckersoni]|uniref:Pre-mRNA-splicing factor 38 n=1 Tax=Potamilus streckersoni TaxID=2493646 RepID=A0AAE0RTA5_9BIVA|nr:hypothetical protein CHS0354_022158 [Potamilus streckersoni]
MANRTVKDAHSIKGTNPQYLVEKIIRTRIYECKYWKEECFALTAELMVDKAMELKYVGGVNGGNIKPTPFICLVLKMLQIQPEKDIIVEFIRNEDFKYVRALGALYMRLTGTSLDCYKYLEPLYLDYRKIKIMDRNGEFHLKHMDEFIDDLLREERICDIILPRIQKRGILEESNQLDARVSALDEDLEDMESEEEMEDMEFQNVQSNQEKKRGHKEQDKPEKSPSPHRRHDRGHSPHRRDRDRGKKRDRDRKHERDKRPREDDDERRKSKKKRDRDRGGDDDKHRRDRHRDKDHDRSHRHRDRGHHDKDIDMDIQQANELRAKLGMAPLKP